MRTTIFLKGCPLNCRWCQNPEGIKAGQEIWWDERRCIHCLACREACSTGAVVEGDKGLHVDVAHCTLCGACVEACPSTAMAYAGKAWTLDQLLAEALKDQDYYVAFGGGVTVSGGEPLRQPELVRELFRKLQEHGVNTALDTCGLASREALRAVLPYTDCILYDIKILDPALHKEYTDQSNEIILDNLAYVANHVRQAKEGSGPRQRLWIRTPLIPETTASEENIAAIGRYIHDHLLDVLERWELCAFNSACKAKYQKMGRAWAYEGCGLMEQREIDRIKAVALAQGIPGVTLVVSGLVARGKA